MELSFWPFQLVVCRYRTRWVSGILNIIRGHSIHSDEEYGKCYFLEELRLWWLTRDWQGIVNSGGVSKFNLCLEQICPLFDSIAAFQPFIPAITLLPSSIDDKYFSVSFGWQLSTDATVMIILPLISWIQQPSSECSSLKASRFFETGSRD